MANPHPFQPEEVERRLPLRALMAHLRIHEVSTFAEAIGLSRKSCYRYFESGLPLYVADRLAIRVGLHPLEVWPDFHQGFGEAA